MNSIKNKIGLILILFIGIFIVPFNALGKNTSNGQWKSQGKKSGAKADQACENDLKTSSLLRVTKTDDTKYTLTIGSSAAKWDIHYYVADDADDTDWSDIIDSNGNLKGTHIKHYSGESETIEIARADENKVLYVVALPNGDGKHVYEKGNAESTTLLKSKYTVVVNDEKVTKETTCKTGSVTVGSSNEVSINHTGAVLKKTIIAKPVTQKKKLSESAQEQCDLMKKAWSKKSDKTDYFTSLKKDDIGNVKEIIDAYNKQMKSSFSYCYDNNYEYDADYTIKAKDIKKIRQSSLKAFYYYYQVKKNEEKNKEYDALPKEGYTKLENLEEKKFSCKSNDFMNQTSRYYYENTTRVPKFCKVTCRENYEIEYSPPQKIKSGLCFNYTVTIKSKVACKTEIDEKFNWPNLNLPSQKQCILSPICDNDDNETQAGPNEKFDSCISSCDGGKYTQKCINSCYNKVYNKKSKVTKTASKAINQKPSLLNNTNNNANNVIKLANKKTAPDPYKNVDGCTSASAIKGNWSKCAEAFSKLKKEYPMGYYNSESEDGEWPSWVDLKWHPCFKGNNGPDKCQYENSEGKEIEYTIDRYDDGKVFVDNDTDQNGTMDTNTLIENIKRSSPYYFATKARAEKTLKSFYAIETGKNGKGKKRFYVIDNRGIKRQHSYNYHCSEKCGFSLDGSDDENIDCRQSKSGGKVDEYINSLNNVAKQFQKCTASDSCATDQATFEISVDEKRGKNEKECSTSTTEKTSRNGTNTKNQANSCPTDESNYEENIKKRPNLIFMPLDRNDVCYGTNGKCYKRDISNLYHYKTTITTPGSWVDKKTGAVTYEDKRQDDKYRAKDIQYCTRYDTCDVNEEWAKQVINATTVNPNDNTSTVDGSKVTITNGLTENITAKIEKFGKYGASFKLSCFYGLTNNPPPTCVGPTCDVKCYINDEGKEVECADDNGGPLPNGGTSKFQDSYDIRVASNESIFPLKSNGKTRFRGYNWGSQATIRSNDPVIQNALNVTGYGVDPVKYSAGVMQKGQKVYEETPEFDVILTEDEMKSLRDKSLEFSGTCNNASTKDIPGLYYCNMGTDFKNSFTHGITINWKLGNNSETAKEAIGR